MIYGDAPPEALHRYTGFMLNWVATRTRKRFFAAMEELGLHARDFGVMNMIAAHPGLAQQELTHATGVDASTMVALLDALEARGLAERRPHPTDRRKRALHLTAAGKQTLAHARTRAAELDVEAFGMLDPAERAELERLLTKLSGG